jgi:kumamolisin
MLVTLRKGIGMRTTLGVAVCGVAVAATSLAGAQDFKPAGTVFTPESSRRQLQPFLSGFEGAVRAYTNIQVFVPATPIEPPTGATLPPAPYFIETPASIACIYGLAPRVDGCNPNLVRANSTGGARVIAIVDAYDAPNIVSDLKTFSERFNLPTANFEVVFADGSRPSADKGWEIEISLDVEWAHAIAPSAKIILVEAKDSQYASLLAAVDKAADLVLKEGGGEISLSWGGSEFAAETSNDAVHFSRPGIVYFAATGDDPGVNYPSSSPQVVAVGGTTIVRDGSGAFVGEKPWASAGAGPSAFEKRPMYQNPIGPVLGSARGVADLAAVADPSVGGVWVYNSANSNVAANKGWLAVGGTSAATPIVAAIANLGGRFASSTNDELSYIYNNSAKFNRIITGTCGPGGVYTSTTGWSYCTGLGSPNGKGGL